MQSKILIILIRWQKRFFTLKEGYLFWYKREKSNEAQNFIDIRKIKKIESHKEKKFLILVDKKLYKFACEDQDEMNSWINIINSEIKRLRIESQKKNEIIYDVKIRKMDIYFEDLWDLNEKLKNGPDFLNIKEQLKNDLRFKEKTSEHYDK